MNKTMGQKLKEFICRKFGHSPDKNNTWTHMGKIRSSCKTCGHIITKHDKYNKWS